MQVKILISICLLLRIARWGVYFYGPHNQAAGVSFLDLRWYRPCCLLSFLKTAWGKAVGGVCGTTHSNVHKLFLGLWSGVTFGSTQKTTDSDRDQSIVGCMQDKCLTLILFLSLSGPKTNF